MNWAAWGPTIVTVATVIFGAGTIYGRIGGHERTLKRHDDTLKDHGGRIESLETQSERAKAWREGFEAGKTHAHRV